VAAGTHRDALAGLLKAGEQLRRDLLLPEPGSGSAARHDLDTAAQVLGTSEAVARVVRLVDLWTMLEADHLRGIGVLLGDATTVFPLFPLLRAVLEHGAWVCWLLDPNVDSPQRAVRAALAELRSDQEIVGVAKRWAGSTTTEYQNAKERLKRIRAAIRRDFGDLDAQNSAVHGERIASPTEVVEHFGTCEGDARQWRGTYEYLCGTATHPSQNAFEFVDFGEAGRTQLTLSADFVNRMARIGLAVFLHSLAHMADYMGWPRDALRTYQARVNGVLGADPSAG
jgi:hypothetical protein